MPATLRSLYFKGIIYMNLLGMTFRQAFLKGVVLGENKVMSKSFSFKIRMVFVFLFRMWKNNVYVFRACRQVIEEIMEGGVREVALCGVNDATKILQILLSERCVNIAGIYSRDLPLHLKCNYKVLPLEMIKGYSGKIIVASFIGIKEKIQRLLSLGVEKKNILRLL